MLSSSPPSGIKKKKGKKKKSKKGTNAKTSHDMIPLEPIKEEDKFEKALQDVSSGSIDIQAI